MAGTTDVKSPGVMCPDCQRLRLLFARGLCAACYKLRREHGKVWDGPPPQVDRRIHRRSKEGICPDCQRMVGHRVRGLCANCYRIRKEAGGDWDGPPPDVQRPTESPVTVISGFTDMFAKVGPLTPLRPHERAALAEVVRVLR